MTASDFGVTHLGKGQSALAPLLTECNPGIETPHLLHN
jgi:hypothetical protein